jgi:hypothetical protein
MSTSARGLRTATFGQLSQTLRVLEDLGLTPEHLKCVRHDRPFAQRLVAFWKAGAGTGDYIPDSAAQAEARGIMGRNFLGLEEVRTALGITLPAEQLAAIPFSEETLRQCMDTHVLVAGAALSLNEIRTGAARRLPVWNWPPSEPYLNHIRMSVRWYLLRKEPVPESRGKTYKKQCSLLTAKEEVPLACEMAYMVLLYWLTYRRRLLPGVHVRCSDTRWDDNRVHIGGFGPAGLTVSYNWDGNYFDSLGLASARKS